MRYLLASAILLAACGGSTSPNGPLQLGIVSGDNQIAPAGSQQLSNPVVGKMVRVFTAQGPRFEFVKTAYAQTVVNGSPVAGAVVCAVSLTEGDMVPFTPCTNTDNDGTATFFFTPGTRAGVARAEIRGTVAGQPAVFDTATATVEPGVAKEIGMATFGPVNVDGGTSVDLHNIILNVKDAYSNFIYAKGSTFGNEGIPSFTPRWVIRDGDSQPYPLYKWSNTGEELPAGTAEWNVTVGQEWSGHRITVFIWVGAAEHHFTAQVR